MLRNETYAGTLWQNRWQCRKVAGKPGQKPKAKTIERPKAEQIPVKVPAIISRDVFESAQRRLRENRSFASRNSKREYLLSGLLKHSCGSRMGGSSARGGITYYRCYRSLRFKAPIDDKGEPQPCPCGWANGKTLDSAVWDTVTSLLRNPELMLQHLESLTQPGSATRETLAEELSQVADLARDQLFVFQLTIFYHVWTASVLLSTL